MSFALLYPYALLLLLLIPCFVWCRKKAKIVYFPKDEWLPKGSFLWDNILLVSMVIYALLVLSLASPFSYKSQSTSHKKGRDLVLVLDTSGSMAERGFSSSDGSQTKYEISVLLAKSFIEHRYDDNVGLVVFGTFAFTASPLTYDLKALNEMFDLMSSVGIAGTSTAIGDALIQGLDTLKVGKAKSKVLVILTDGVHNAGENSPHQAVLLAKEQGVKIYTIGIGKKEDYDVKLLTKLAQETKAKSFFCKDSDALKEVYEEIDKLEPSHIRSEEYLQREMLFLYPLLLAMALLLLLIFKEEEMV